MHSKPEHKPFVEPVQKSDEDLYVDALVAAAPPLTDQQRTALAELLRPVRISGASCMTAPDTPAVTCRLTADRCACCRAGLIRAESLACGVCLACRVTADSVAVTR